MGAVVLTADQIAHFAHVMAACSPLSVMEVVKSHEALRGIGMRLAAENARRASVYRVVMDERDAALATLNAIRDLTWDPKARGMGSTLPRDISPSANRIIRAILGEEA